MSILEKVKKQMEKQANVMEGRTKGEIKELTAYLIKDFTILKDKNTDNEKKKVYLLCLLVKNLKTREHI